jgi:hypothetical protein
MLLAMRFEVPLVHQGTFHLLSFGHLLHLLQAQVPKISKYKDIIEKLMEIQEMGEFAVTM